MANKKLKLSDTQKANVRVFIDAINKAQNSLQIYVSAIIEDRDLKGYVLDTDKMEFITTPSKEAALPSPE